MYLLYSYKVASCLVIENGEQHRYYEGNYFRCYRGYTQSTVVLKKT